MKLLNEEKNRSDFVCMVTAYVRMDSIFLLFEKLTVKEKSLPKTEDFCNFCAVICPLQSLKPLIKFTSQERSWFGPSVKSIHKGHNPHIE